MRPLATGDYDVVMPTPRSIRFDADTLEALAAFAARHAGLSISSAAALLVEEGLRMDAHPGVVFQEGPTGRRATLVGGPDVWEIVRALRDARSADPSVSASEIVDIVCENSVLDRAQVQVALDYYGVHPDEVDAHVSAADTAERDLERTLEQTRRLLGS